MANSSLRHPHPDPSRHTTIRTTRTRSSRGPRMAISSSSIRHSTPTEVRLHTMRIPHRPVSQHTRASSNTSTTPPTTHRRYYKRRYSSTIRRTMHRVLNTRRGSTAPEDMARQKRRRVQPAGQWIHMDTQLAMQPVHTLRDNLRCRSLQGMVSRHSSSTTVHSRARVSTLILATLRTSSSNSTEDIVRRLLLAHIRRNSHTGDISHLRRRLLNHRTFPTARQATHRGNMLLV